MLKAFIVDDEYQSRAYLSSLLTRLFPGIEISGMAATVAEGIDGIKRYQPDIVFLDIQMKGETGFDLLNSLPVIHFSLVVISAFDRFAVKAFRFNAIDYLLKPIIEEELAAAIEKIKRQSVTNQNIAKQQVEQLYHDIRNPQKPHEKIVIPTVDGFTVIPVNTILYCKASRNYTEFHLIDKKVFVSSYTLKQYDDMLTSQSFFRAHRSYLLNIAHIKHYRRGDGGWITMSNGHDIELSKTHKNEFLRLLNAGV
jgi:two-component system LytT family response regulator